MSDLQQVIIVERKRTGVIAGVIAGVLALLGIFSFGIVFVPLAIIVALIGSIVAVKNFNIGGVGVNVLSWVLIGVGVAVSPGIWVALALFFGGQTDQSIGSAAIREQVEEGEMLAGSVKGGVAFYYEETGVLPSSNAEIEEVPALEIVGKYVKSVSVEDDGNISVGFNSYADPSIRSHKLFFRAKVEGGYVRWECSSTIDQSLLPDSCQSLSNIRN
jgi:hypothetical protein